MITPGIGGIYSIFGNLRENLLSRGVELRWVGSGSVCAKRLAAGTFEDELRFGTIVAPDDCDDAKRGAALVELCEAGEYEGIFVSVFGGVVETNFVRYLNSEIPRILVVHSITVGTYRAARAVRDYVHATVGVSPRIVEDLVKSHGFDRHRTFVIPNGIQVEKFSSSKRRESSDGVRVLFLGRMEDGAKGCFLLPKVISQVRDAGVSVQWRIAGDGPDLAELRRRCSAFPNVEFLGHVPHERVQQALAQADIYIFPSRYEGFGISLVEAMAAGCVPIASAIQGVTDKIVEHGKTGYLFQICDTRRAAEHVVQLACEPALLRSMSTLARETVADRFHIENIGKQYGQVIDWVLTNRPPLKPALNLRKWTYPRGLRPGLRTCLPEGLKIRLRALRESIHARMG